MKNDRTRFVSSRQRAGRKKINEDHWRDYTRINSYLYSRYFSRSSSREDWRHAVSVLPTETVKILSAARMATLLARLNESKHKIQWNWKIFLIRVRKRTYTRSLRIHVPYTHDETSQSPFLLSFTGSHILLEKLRKYKPKIAVFNGKLIYEVFSGKKDFGFGRQPNLVEGTNTVRE